MRIAGLNEDQRTFELAERAYTYNPRFPVAMAIKTIYSATSEVEKAVTDSTVQSPRLLLADAKTTLKKSQEYLKEQKKAFPEHYSTLKKKNRTKNQEGNQYIRQIKTDDKRAIAQSKKYTHTTIVKNKGVRKKYGTAKTHKRSINRDKISEIDAAKQQKKKESPEIMAYNDSLTSRQLQLRALQPEILAQKEKIKNNREHNLRRLDSLSTILQLSDSLLVKETVCRLSMHDNYDDDVIALSGQFKNVKYKQVDTLEKYYLSGFDTIAAGYEKLQRIQLQQMSIYKKNVRTLEQYKKWNSNDNAVDTMYSLCVNNYMQCIDTFITDLAEYSGYVKGNKAIFSWLGKESRRQQKITEYMVKAEDVRNKMEKRALAGKLAFDKKENEKQVLAVKKIQKKVQEISNNID